MTTREHKPYKSLITSMLDKLPHINQWRRDFLIETFILFLSIRGHINFLQLGRYGKYEEQRYRQQFEKSFDFLTFNKELTLSQGSSKYVIAFDPSIINKSGKKHPGLAGIGPVLPTGPNGAWKLEALLPLILITILLFTWKLFKHSIPMIKPLQIGMPG
jgi:hypothetical protein